MAPQLEHPTAEAGVFMLPRLPELRRAILCEHVRRRRTLAYGWRRGARSGIPAVLLTTDRAVEPTAGLEPATV